MDSIEVSIIIPTYNRKENLRKALKSLFDQTYLNDKYEIIVCDDYRSNDTTEGLVKELMRTSPCNLRYFKVKSEFKGPGPARNLGIEKARGDIIGFTDDDCVVSPNWIKSAMPVFNDKSVGGVQGCTLPLEPKVKKNKLFWVKHTNKALRPHYLNYATCNVFYRKEVLNMIGGFDPRFTMAREDLDVAWSILEKGLKIIFNKDALVYHRTTYISLPYYLKSLKKHESLALFIKKHPILRKKMFLRFVSRKSSIYPMFILLAISTYLIGYNLFFNIFGVSAIFLFLWARVITDSEAKMYPVRVIGFVRYLLIDFISLYYTIKGVIRYRCLVI